MNRNTPNRWPDDYLTWTGSFKDLVSASAEVLAVLDPTVKAPNERLLRYYQQESILGRGQKLQDGNRAVFSFDDLERVVAAKGLVKQNWTLSNAAKLLSSTDPSSESVTSLLYASPAPMGTPSLSMASASLASATPQQATDVVARLMARSGLGASAPASSVAMASASASGASGSNPGFLRSAFQASALPNVSSTLASPQKEMSPAPSAVQSVQAIRPASWLAVYIDQTALQGAAESERTQARQALEALLETLR